MSLPGAIPQGLYSSSNLVPTLTYFLWKQRRKVVSLRQSEAASTVPSHNWRNFFSFWGSFFFIFVLISALKAVVFHCYNFHSHLLVSLLFLRQIVSLGIFYMCYFYAVLVLPDHCTDFHTWSCNVRISLHSCKIELFPLISYFNLGHISTIIWELLI